MSEGTSTPTVTIQGFSNPDWSLLYMNRVVPLGSDGNFQLSMPVSHPEETISFIAVSPYGKVAKTRVILEAKNWGAIQAMIHPPSQPEKKQSRFHWSLGLGVTHVDYSRTDLAQISSLLISTTGYAEYWLKPDTWDLALSGYYTPPPLTTSPSGYSIEFLGLNARAGYVLPWVKSPWRLTLMAGIYYATTFTSSPVGGFGYVNIGGPEIFPTLSRTSSNSGSRVSAYFKLSPVSDQFTLLSLASREIAAGLDYDFPPNPSPIPMGRPGLVRFDWANLVVNSSGPPGLLNDALARSRVSVVTPSRSALVLTK